MSNSYSNIATTGMIGTDGFRDFRFTRIAFMHHFRQARTIYIQKIKEKYIVAAEPERTHRKKMGKNSKSSGLFPGQTAFTDMYDMNVKKKIKWTMERTENIR